MRFWKAYFTHRSIYNDLSEADVLDIVNQGDSGLVPYFFLYLLNPEQYETERKALLKTCSANPTSKNRWILSLIDTDAMDA